MQSRNANSGRIFEAAKEQAATGDVRKNIFIGTSGWAYASWKPDFYPQTVPAKKFLEYYATKLNSVEVNYTFRQLPTASMLAGWMAATGDDFRFSFKAPQNLTHIRRLKDCAQGVTDLARALEAVTAANRLGVVLFQLPPNFKADPARLDVFMAYAKTSGLRIAFEFRHNSWFCDDVFSILRQHDAALCVAESEDLETPDIVTAPFMCYRLRKSEYSPVQLNALADNLRKKCFDGEVFAYFKHEEQPTGALSAVVTLGLVRQSA